MLNMYNIYVEPTHQKLLELRLTCKTSVKSPLPTNQNRTFYRPGALPVAQPTVSKHWK